MKWMILLVCLGSLGTLLSFIYLAKAQDKPTIDIVLKNSSSEYWRFMRAGIVKAYANIGADGKIYIPEKGDTDQTKILQSALKEKPDALIVSLTNPTMAKPILEKFKKEQIPVLLVDTEADWPGQTSFIGTDNKNLGRKAGELLASMLQPGDKVALISQLAHNTLNTDRTQGAKDILTAAGMKIAAEKETPESNNTVKAIMDRILQKNPDLKGVFAVNDEIALEVLNYSKQKGLGLQVVGSDGSIKMITAVENGTVKGTIAQNPYDIGYMSIEYAVKAIKGENIEKRINSGIDLITKDNSKSKKAFLQQILQEEE